MNYENENQKFPTYPFEKWGPIDSTTEYDFPMHTYLMRCDSIHYIESEFNDCIIPPKSEFELEFE